MLGGNARLLGWQASAIRAATASEADAAGGVTGRWCRFRYQIRFGRAAARHTRLILLMRSIFGLRRLEPVCRLGRKLDLTGLPVSRRVHLAPRGTGRRKADRDPGSHLGINFRKSCVCPLWPPDGWMVTLGVWSDRRSGFATSRTDSGNEVDTKETLE